MICYEGLELRSLFEEPKRKWVAEEIIRRGYTPDALRKDLSKMMEIVNASSLVDDKEEVEIFSALYLFPQFYPTGSKICFLLENGFDPMKTPINSLTKLKESIKEKDLTDFCFLGDDGLRAFQLKAYTGETTHEGLFGFLKKKLLHYSNNIGNVNLLIVLQSKGDIGENFFEFVHENLKTLNIKGGGHILISYNEDNKFDLIVTVYPMLGTTKIPHKMFSV